MSQKKVVGLLEITGAVQDGPKYIASFNYFNTLYPNFINVEIVDNQNSIPYTIQLLDEYYAKGYRVFFGPLTTRMVNGVINWYSTHPDTTALIPAAIGNSLNISNNMFRLQPSDFYFMNYIKNSNSTTQRVFYLYNPNQLACNDLLTTINTLFSQTILYPVETDASLNVTDLQTFFTNNSISSPDIVIAFLINRSQRETYFNLFDTISIGNVKQYDAMPVSFPKVENNISNLYGNYYCILISSVNTTGLYDAGITALGKLYAINSLTSLYLLGLFANNENVDNAYSYGEAVPWFDDNNCLKYWSYGIYTYTSNGFIKTNIYLNDPTYGTITFNQKV